MTVNRNNAENAKQDTKTGCFPSGSILLRAVILGAVLLVLCGISLSYIFLQCRTASPSLEAGIYQNGTLLETIDLSAVTESYTFVIESPDGGFNTIAIRPGAIGICDADCPDKLCVEMGYVDSSLLPIICLPHSLVIEVVEKEGSQVDGVTY